MEAFMTEQEVSRWYEVFGDVVYCLEILKERDPEYKDAHIALVTGDIQALSSDFLKRKAVIYRKSGSDFCTVELPLPKEEIEKRIAEGLLLLTKGTVVGVPMR